MAAEAVVWHSDCLIVSEHGAGMYIDADDDRPAREIVRMHQQVKAGVSLERNAFADPLRITDAKRDYALLGDFFMAGFPCVSGAFKAFLEAEGVGEPAFYPIDILLTDSVTMRPEPYSILNLRCQRRL